MTAFPIKDLLGFSLFASLAACSTYEQGAVSDTNNDILSASCPVIEASDFRAWVNAMPGSSEPTFNISGQVVFPSAGYLHELKLGMLDRRRPPTQRLTLEVTAPNGPSAQAMTTQEVSGQFPAPASRYQAVTIICGGEVIVEINEVEEVS